MIGFARLPLVGRVDGRVPPLDGRQIICARAFYDSLDGGQIAIGLTMNGFDRLMVDSLALGVRFL